MYLTPKIVAFKILILNLIVHVSMAYAQFQPELLAAEKDILRLKGCERKYDTDCSEGT